MVNWVQRMYRRFSATTLLKMLWLCWTCSLVNRGSQVVSLQKSWKPLKQWKWICRWCLWLKQHTCPWRPDSPVFLREHSNQSWQDRNIPPPSLAEWIHPHHPLMLQTTLFWTSQTLKPRHRKHPKPQVHQVRDPPQSLAWPSWKGSHPPTWCIQ